MTTTPALNTKLSQRTLGTTSTFVMSNETTLPEYYTIKPKNWKSWAMGGMMDWGAIPDWVKAPHLRKINSNHPWTLGNHGLSMKGSKDL
jgi:hypothetical protein